MDCQMTTYNIQHTTYNIQHTTYNIQHTTYNITDFIFEVILKKKSNLNLNSFP
jgi:antitoxin PrlF